MLILLLLMSLASLVPSIVADPFHTPVLLQPSVMETMVLPYREEYTGVAPTGTDCPCWTAELEAYHQLVHPLAWANMGVDDVIDAAALKALSIHVARTRYIEHQRRTTSASSTSEVLAALPGQGEFTPPPAEPYSLWPIFALPPPPLDASRLVTLWNCDDWSRFTFPAPPPVANSAAAFATEDSLGGTSLAVKPCSSVANATLETASWTAPVISTPAYELRQRHPQKAQSTK
ncbi:hypothetical protein NBRC10512_001898 [Rhodotorula toruloides]